MTDDDYEFMMQKVRSSRKPVADLWHLLFAKKMQILNFVSITKGVQALGTGFGWILLESLWSNMASVVSEFFSYT
jgi:hypothetical protein